MPFTPDDPVDYDGLPIAWSRYDIETWLNQRGLTVWEVTWSTNDNYDLGYPSDPAHDQYNFTDIRRMFRHVGGYSHRGNSHTVWVFYEGMEVKSALDMQQIILMHESWSGRDGATVNL